MDKFNPDIHHRRTIRLRGYDYSTVGAYFVTICVNRRGCLLGKVVDGEMQLNNAGRMVRSVWDEMPEHYPGVEIDEFAVMPNHIHGIVFLVGAGPRARTKGRQPQEVAPTLSLPDVVHRFKTMTTHQYTRGVKEYGWTPFPGKLWQRNYYDHIIRNEDDLNALREYIVNNPVKWETDENFSEICWDS